MAGGRREGAGRKPGIPNKTTTAVKEAILAAFDRVGGVDYLADVAKTDPKTFCALLGKVLPMQVAGNLDVNASVLFKTIYENRGN